MSFEEEQARISAEVDAELEQWPTPNDHDAASWRADGTHEHDPPAWEVGAVIPPLRSLAVERLARIYDVPVELVERSMQGPRLAPTAEALHVINQARRALRVAIMPELLLNEFDIVAIHPRAGDGDQILGMPAIRGPIGVGLVWKGADHG